MEIRFHARITNGAAAHQPTDPPVLGFLLKTRLDQLTGQVHSQISGQLSALQLLQIRLK